MHIIILGTLLVLVVIIAIFFIKRIIEVILAFLLYIVVIGLSSAAIISYIISRLFDLDFLIVFPITLVISVLTVSIIIDRYQPESKKISKKVEEDKSMGLLNSAKNAVSSATEKVKDSVSENVKDKVLDVSKSVKGSVAESVKDSFFFSHNKDIDRMNVIRFNSSHLTDEQLIDYVKNKSIDLYEKMGYAAAFADRYPPKK